MPQAETKEANGLLPCPFCGCSIHMGYDGSMGYFGPDGQHDGACLIGSIDWRDFAAEAQAVREWNRRAPSAAPDLVEALKDLPALPAAAYAMRIVQPIDDVPEAAWWRARAALAKLEPHHAD